MIYELHNSLLHIQVSSLGGELCSLKTADNTEYLWQGDPATWNDQAPNLFPYIARLTEGKYTYKGSTYHMDIHGFLKDSELTCVEQTNATLSLALEDNEMTRSQYPFSFCLTITYTLDNANLHVSYNIKNKGCDTMYFGIGGHPGFCVPLEKDLAFEDYYIQFEEGTLPRQIVFTKDCFVTDKDRILPLTDTAVLPLTHSMFDDDAYIFKAAGTKVTLKSDKSPRTVTMDYSDFPYLGIWQYPHSAVKYVCLEPWSSLPSRDKIIEDLETQPSLLSLDPGTTCTKSWHLTIA